MAWWSGNKLRLIQTNLREIDADLDVDALISELKQYRTNVWMMNAGGMFAFYPTQLPFQYATPYLKKDLLGEAVSKAHANGMRFIARFDFSKAHESLFAANPEWFYRTREGREVNYHGIVHTCLNSRYQQELSLAMIEEVLSRYPVDGIFFNMFGYQHWDYSGNFYGPCYCENCKQRFHAMYGEDLLTYTGPGHDLHDLYRTFHEVTSQDILARIHDAVKARYPQVAICTYHPHKVDIVRKESNTSLTRPHPVWLYSASENVAAIEDSWDDKLVSNCSINAIDLTYRFTGVSEHETRIRLYESIASGSGLDFCIIGRFEGYPDKANYAAAQEVFRFHAEHEAYFGDLRSIAAVVLVKPADPRARLEYHGLFKMLKERHILFDVIVEGQLAANLAKLEWAKAVLLPGPWRADASGLAVLEQAQAAGTALIATGSAFLEDEATLAKLFAARFSGTVERLPAAYLEVKDNEWFPSLAGRDWIIAGEAIARMGYETDVVQEKLRLVEPAHFGPPERAYGHQLGSHSGLGIATRANGGAGLYYPWDPGSQYYRFGFEDHKFAVTDVLEHLLGDSSRVTAEAPASTELFASELADGNLLIQLLNLSGFNGTTFHPPLPVSGIRITVQVERQPVYLRHLRTGEAVAWQEAEGGRLIFTVPQLACYEAFVLEYSEAFNRKEG